MLVHVVLKQPVATQLSELSADQVGGQLVRLLDSDLGVAEGGVRVSLRELIVQQVGALGADEGSEPEDDVRGLDLLAVDALAVRIDRSLYLGIHSLNWQFGEGTVQLN